jgi:hypothetical protein
MNWKHFLKPDNRKIVIVFAFIIVFLLVNYIIVYISYWEISTEAVTSLYFSNEWFRQCSNVVWSGNISEFNNTLQSYGNSSKQLGNKTAEIKMNAVEQIESYRPLLMFVSLGNDIGIMNIWAPETQSYVLSVILECLAYWYVFSCIIVWFYDSVKGRK